MFQLQETTEEVCKSRSVLRCDPAPSHKPAEVAYVDVRSRNSINYQAVIVQAEMKRLMEPFKAIHLCCSPFSILLPFKFAQPQFPSGSL